MKPGNISCIQALTALFPALLVSQPLHTSFPITSRFSPLQSPILLRKSSHSVQRKE